MSPAWTHHILSNGPESFIGIPKCGSSSMAKFLIEERGFVGVNKATGTKYAFVRHPLDRWISQVYQVWQIKKYHKKEEVPTWDAVCKRGYVDDEPDVHLFPQHSFLDGDEKLYRLEDQIIPGEHLRRMEGARRKSAEFFTGWESYAGSTFSFPIDLELWTGASTDQCELLPRLTD